MSQDKLIFKSFYMRHFKAVNGFCRVFVKEDEVALDITQDAFFRLYERWDASYTVQNAQAFIYITAKNLCMDHLRRRKTETMDAVKEVLVSDHFLLEEIIRQEAIAAIQQAISTLSGRNSEVIRLVMQGKSNQEIANELHISLNTVKWIKKEAYSRLRKIIGNEYIVLLLLENLHWLLENI